MCNKSETIGKIAAALVAFNGEVKKIEKDGTNPHFKSAYATLDNIIDETRPILHKHGLTVMQFPGGDGERITVRTMVMHESGEWIESEPLTLRPTKNDPQGAGSAITYGRRYSYAAALSLSLGDDDDGNAASEKPANGSYSAPSNNHPPRQQQDNQPPAQFGGASITEAQIGLIKKMLKDKQVPDDAYRLMISPKTSTKDLTKSEASAVIKRITEYVPEPEYADGMHY